MSVLAAVALYQKRGRASSQCAFAAGALHLLEGAGT
jgi:hypothetical protein